MSVTNRQITLAARPEGFPQESDFRLVESQLDGPGPGEFLVETLYLSVDPYMRGRMNDRRSYAPSVELGEVMVGGAVGRVLESRHDGFAAGDIVEGRIGWQSHALCSGQEVRRVDPELAPISTALGVLGMPGLTAYFGLLDIGQPIPGDTVLVSAAAGAVGSIVGQIAQICGCRAVGVAGTDEKVRYVTGELGFDAAINYREVGDDYVAALTEVCPEGIDVYFDNVGGPLTDAVLQTMNVQARVAICGQISQYNLTRVEMAPRLLWKLIEKRARIEGFLVFQFADRYEQGLKRLGRWVREGKLKYREQMIEGLENAPRAFLEMMQGANIGKQLVRVAAE